MKLPRIVLVLMSLVSCWAQVFPSAVATDANLLVARNDADAKLATGINNSATTIVLTSGATFGNNMAIRIGAEIIFCPTLTTNTFSGCTRGFNGTSAASHSSQAIVKGFMIAAHHNALAAEVKAIEGALGVGMANVPAALTVKQNSTTVQTSVGSVNENTGTGVACVVTTPGAGSITRVCDADFNKVLFNPLVTETSTSSTVHTGTIAFTPANYAAIKGYPLYWVWTHAGTGGTTNTVNINGLGAKALKQCDHLTDPTTEQLAIGNTAIMTYDATADLFRLPGCPPTAAPYDEYFDTVSRDINGMRVTGSFFTDENVSGGGCCALYAGILLPQNSSDHTVYFRRVFPASTSTTLTLYGTYDSAANGTGTFTVASSYSCATDGTDLSALSYTSIGTITVVVTVALGRSHGDVSYNINTCAAGYHTVLKFVLNNANVDLDKPIMLGIRLH